MKRGLLTRVALATALMFSTSLAIPAGGGGTPPPTKQVCKWVQVPVMVSDGHDKYGFPINPRIVYQWFYFCKTVAA